MSLGLGQVYEDIGDPLPFEAPFWADGSLVRPGPGQPTRYQPSFAPFQLSEAALRALMGFRQNARRADNDVDPFAVALVGFGVPSARPITQADLDEFLRTHRRRHYRLGPGGTLIPVADG